MTAMLSLQGEEHLYCVNVCIGVPTIISPFTVYHKFIYIACSSCPLFFMALFLSLMSSSSSSPSLSPLSPFSHPSSSLSFPFLSPPPPHNRLAEARSNPHLLAIGEHMNRQDMRDDILEHMRGDKSAADISKSRSHETLVTL